MISTKVELFNALHAEAYSMMETGIPVTHENLCRVGSRISDLPKRIISDESHIVLTRVETEMDITPEIEPELPGDEP